MGNILQVATERGWPYWATEDLSVILLCADCLNLLPQLEAGSVDAVVTDPPYGIGEAKNNNASRSCLAASKDYGQSDWDNEPASQEAIAECRRVSSWQVIFGGNYFDLPPSSCWLVWDKLNGANDFADCELAWTNLRRAVRRIQFRWHGMIRDEDGERFHPTQKPVRVMEWCFEQIENARTIGSGLADILDPFMGSGTTGVACVRTGRRFIGIEKEPKYFDIACRRIEAELQKTVLLEKPPKIIQRNMFDV
jgi:DNA modification methylase